MTEPNGNQALIEGIAKGGVLRGQLPQLEIGGSNCVIAIDPGDEHCGFAWFIDGKCIGAAELAPWFAIIAVRTLLLTGWPTALVIEEFKLYPWMAQQQSFSELLTPQLIGVLRYLWGEHAPAYCELVMQGASIKKPTAAILKARKTVSMAKKLRVGGHAGDAELHGHYYLNNNQGKGQQHG